MDVPVAPGSPQAGSATPVPAPPGWGAPGVAPPVAPRPPAAAPTPQALPPVLPYLRGPYAPPQRRSLADMANEQLRRGQPRDALTEGMESAGRDDCLHGKENEGAVRGLLRAPELAARALTGKCAK